MPKETLRNHPKKRKERRKSLKEMSTQELLALENMRSKEYKDVLEVLRYREDMTKYILQMGVGLRAEIKKKALENGESDAELVRRAVKKEIMNI